ncbi:MAG: tRNA (adenosine(37)-N6)-threonylcarbamoyltransferase complex transferase subunit TsaD [Candidatus Levyibacteriota bacterium]
MKILGIETSCDETSAAIIEAKSGNRTVKLLSNVIASSLPLHAKTGGIIPEIAARNQLTFMLPVVKKACKDAGIELREQIAPEIDAIAVTVGPGLIGSLLVGVETAKTFSYIWNKPLIPVNHLFGHMYANFITDEQTTSIDFPAIALIVSGGHTDLVYLEGHNKIQWLGGTRDDASGEAFDKIGRLLKLPYPGGPSIEKAAKNGHPKAFRFPRALLDDKAFDFSFSGLKTAVLREVQKRGTLDEQVVADISFAVQDAIIDVLIKKTLTAAENYAAKSILLGGGVAANQALRDAFEKSLAKEHLQTKLFAPKKSLCTDNAAMIATAGFFHNKTHPWKDITANPELYFD